MMIDTTSISCGDVSTSLSRKPLNKSSFLSGRRNISIRSSMLFYVSTDPPYWTEQCNMYLFSSIVSEMCGMSSGIWIYLISSTEENFTASSTNALHIWKVQEICCTLSFALVISSQGLCPEEKMNWESSAEIFSSNDHHVSFGIINDR